MVNVCKSKSAQLFLVANCCVLLEGLPKRESASSSAKQGGARFICSKLRVSAGLQINMEPENTPLEQEKHPPNHHFQVLS